MNTKTRILVALALVVGILIGSSFGPVTHAFAANSFTGTTVTICLPGYTGFGAVSTNRDANGGHMDVTFPTGYAFLYGWQPSDYVMQQFAWPNVKADGERVRFVGC